MWDVNRGPRGSFWNDGTYSGIRPTAVKPTLTSLQPDYGMEGDMSVKDRYLMGGTHGIKIVVSHNCVFMSL